MKNFLSYGKPLDRWGYEHLKLGIDDWEMKCQILFTVDLFIF